MLSAEFGQSVSLVQMKVSNLCIYRFGSRFDPNRITRIADWLKKKGGRKITENVFFFAEGKEPTFEDFEVTFSPLSPGEGITLARAMEGCMKLDVTVQTSEVDDVKMHFK